MNKKKIILVGALMILFLGMGFAAGRADLKINGNVKMDDMKWDIHFENLEEREGSVVAEEPAFYSNDSHTEISFSVNLPNLGDKYEFDVDIKNAGTIDAVLDSITKSSVPPELRNYVEYIVEYKTDGQIGQCDELDAGESKRVHVKLAVKESVDAEDLPTSEEPVEFKVVFNYVQAGECPLN